MSLAELYNSPNTPEDLQSWAFSHMAHHKDISRVVFDRYNMRIDEFPLDPFNPEDFSNMESWLEQHQQMHNQQNQAMSIQGYALNEVDWKDEDQRSAWLTAHADEHFRANEILGV